MRPPGHACATGADAGAEIENGEQMSAVIDRVKECKAALAADPDGDLTVV